MIKIRNQNKKKINHLNKNLRKNLDNQCQFHGLDKNKFHKLFGKNELFR